MDPLCINHNICNKVITSQIVIFCLHLQSWDIHCTLHLAPLALLQYFTSISVHTHGRPILIVLLLFRSSQLVSHHVSCYFQLSVCYKIVIVEKNIPTISKHAIFVTLQTPHYKPSMQLL
jgi:hypothetical protein